MERPAMNKNKKGKRSNMKVFCVTPHPTTVEENNTSIYEINIESDIEFLLNGGRGSIKVVPVGQPRVSVQDCTLERKKEVVGKDFENPFIESYYPVLESISSKPAETEPEKKEVKEVEEEVKEIKEVNEEAEIENPEGEKEKKVIETADKENQSPSLHLMDEFRKNARNHIIRSFLANQFLDMKSTLEDREGTGLHFHHHEHHHHHHYHMNEKWDDGAVSNTTLETFCRMDKKRRKGKDETKGSAPKEPSSTSSSTFTKLTDESRIPKNVLRVLKDLKGPEDANESTKVSTKDSGLLQPRISSSVDIISERNSELLHSHIFSDTELSKLDDMTVFSGSFEVESNSLEYNTVVKNLKSLNSLKAPVVITDQKTLPKFSYITCECSSAMGSDTSSEALIVKGGKKGNQKEEVWLRENDSSQYCDAEAGMGHTDTGPKSMKKSSRQLEYDIWNTSVVEELKQIKKKIRRIEKRRSKEKKSPIVPFRSNTQSSDPKSTYPVTIYSNRTFIVAPENVCLVSWWKSSRYEGYKRRRNT